MFVPLRIPGDLRPLMSPAPDACLCSATRILSRYVSRPLDRFLAGQGLTITEFQVLVVLERGPSRGLALACRLRLDPGHISRALGRLEERGLVRRATPWRFTEWTLEQEGMMHLELLEPGWRDVNDEIHRVLGGDLSRALLDVVDHLRFPARQKHQGWSTE